jgi:hypothetical protein
MTSTARSAWAGLVAFVALAVATPAASAKEERMVEYEGVSAPPTGKALVVFMRPTSFGGAIKATVYDVSSSEPQFLGISSRKTKIAYVADPGKHVFMVVGENADFMDADLVADKTYYVLVSPRMGMWKARFSLLPIRNDAGKEGIQGPSFAKWNSKSKWIQRGPGADAWYAEHKADIADKQAKYLAKWNARPAAEKTDQYLRPEDGV